jgi:hypothetical protein
MLKERRRRCDKDDSSAAAGAGDGAAAGVRVARPRGLDADRAGVLLLALGMLMIIAH